VFTPYAQLVHYESVTRKAVKTQAEIDLFHSKWMKAFPRDPYYNPNLSADYRIRLSDAE
jgi:O-antigen biosynthesis protein